MVKKSCSEDNNFSFQHKDTNIFGNRKFKYENVKLMRVKINKERILLIFCKLNFFKDLFFELRFQLDSAILFFNINVSIDSKKIVRGLGNVLI